MGALGQPAHLEGLSRARLGAYIHAVAQEWLEAAAAQSSSRKASPSGLGPFLLPALPQSHSSLEKCTWPALKAILIISLWSKGIWVTNSLAIRGALYHPRGFLWAHGFELLPVSSPMGWYALFRVPSLEFADNFCTRFSSSLLHGSYSPEVTNDSVVDCNG